MLLLCDLDDTLCDSLGFFRAWATSFAREHSIDEAGVEWIIMLDRAGVSDREDFFTTIAAEFALSSGARELYEAFLADYYPTYRANPGVLEAMDRVKTAGHSVALVTNGLATQRLKVTACGLDPYLDAVCISAVDGYAKPDPAIFQLAAQRSGLTLEGAWMVGDTPALDIAGAHAAGIRSAWITNGRSWDISEYSPAFAAASFPEVVAHVL